MQSYTRAHVKMNSRHQTLKLHFPFYFSRENFSLFLRLSFSRELLPKTPSPGHVPLRSALSGRWSAKIARTPAKYERERARRSGLREENRSRAGAGIKRPAPGRGEGAEDGEQKGHRWRRRYPRAVPPLPSPSLAPLAGYVRGGVTLRVCQVSRSEARRGGGSEAAVLRSLLPPNEEQLVAGGGGEPLWWGKGKSDLAVRD